jgi:hypothetical protein
MNILVTSSALNQSLTDFLLQSTPIDESFNIFHFSEFTQGDIRDIPEIDLILVDLDENSLLKKGGDLNDENYITELKTQHVTIIEDAKRRCSLLLPNQFKQPAHGIFFYSQLLACNYNPLFVKKSPLASYCAELLKFMDSEFSGYPNRLVGAGISAVSTLGYSPLNDSKWHPDSPSGALEYIKSSLYEFKLALDDYSKRNQIINRPSEDFANTGHLPFNQRKPTMNILLTSRPSNNELFRCLLIGR